MFDRYELANLPISEWNAEDINQSVYDRFLKIALEYPNNIAIHDVNNSLTYNQLLNLINSIIQKLYNLNSTDDIIGIYLPTGSLYIASMLAVLNQNLPYIPLDINHSAELLNSIIKNSKLNIIITVDSFLPKLQNIFNNKIITIDEGISYKDLDFGTEHYDVKSNENSIACIIYTSGTSGNTKGVYQSHKILLKDIMDYSISIHISINDVMSWFYSPSVGGAVRDIYGALLNGASLVVMNPKEMSISDMTERTNKYKITIFHAIPSLLRIFLNYSDNHTFQNVRLVYIAGDKFYSEEISQVFAVFPENCIIYNGIGATECTTLYCQWFINSSTKFESKILPVGYPTTDKHVNIVNENNEECGVGEIGEAIINSEFIALGYWNNQELSEKAFKINPENIKQRIYRTNDLFKKLADGNLEYIGRKDNLTKISGYLVNLNLIEANFRIIKNIDEVTVYSENYNNEDIIIAVYKKSENSIITEGEIRNELLRTLPINHIPKYIIEMLTMPFLHNYKYDIQSIKKYVNDEILKSQSVNHHSDNLIILIWNKHLPKSISNPGYTFSELGGDSLSAIKIITELEQYYPNLNNGLIHQKQTISNLLNEMKEFSSRNLPILIIIPPRGGTYQSIEKFAQNCSQLFIIKIVKFPDIFDKNALDLSILELAQISVSYIKSNTSSKSVNLMGLSYGARISHDTASLLKNDGYDVKHFVWDIGPYFKNPHPYIERQGLTKRLIQYYKNGEIFKLSIDHLKSKFNKFTSGFFLKMKVLYFKKFREEELKKEESKLLHQLSFEVIKDWKPMFFDGTLFLLYSKQRTDKKTPATTDNFGWNPYSKELVVIGLDAKHTEIFEDFEMIYLLLKYIHFSF